MTSTPITEIDIETIAKMTITDGIAESLRRLMFNVDKETLRMVGSSWYDTAPVKKKILEWIKGLTQEELGKFVDAGKDKEPKRPFTSYQMVWSLIGKQMGRELIPSDGRKLLRKLEVGNWKQYFLDMAEARLDIGKEPDAIRPFYEVEALLKYQKSRGSLLSHKEKKETLAKVLNMLSASDGWDPKAKWEEFVKTNSNLKNVKKYRDDPTLWLDELLKGGGVDAEGREQVNLLLYAGGTYNGDEATDPARNIDNYLSLKRKAHRKYLNKRVHGLSTENILTTISKVKPGSLEHWLLREDKKLLTQIREELPDLFKQKAMNEVWAAIYRTLDLNKEWENLDSRSSEAGEDVMPEPPSKDDLKTFKDKYKDDDAKKKIWAAKYTLTYALTQCH